MILKRPELDKYLRNKQNGFRVGRTTVGHTLTLTRLIEGVKFNPKRAGGRNPPPLRHFFVTSLPVVIFSRWNFLTFFFKPCARFKTIFIKIGPRVMMRRCVIARWVQRKNWFSIEITHKSCFFFFLSFRIHFHYVLSYLFSLFGVRTCVSILWHTSLLKNAAFTWKNSEKPWFWRFLVIFVFLT